MQMTKEKVSTAFESMKDAFEYKNVMSAPKLEKIVISSGTGRKVKADKKANELILDRISQITGQKPSERQAKKSNAGFKIREGDKIGVAVTLRGEKMFSFIDKFINIAVPRMKDFRGFERKALDNIGNLTLGLKEHAIFPETGDEDIRDLFGMSITFVTTAKTKEEAEAFFDHIGIPFKKKG